MALTEEWRHRVESWQRGLWSLCYRPLEPVALSGFITAEQLTPIEALARPFQPMPPGTSWGAKWQYAWFRGEIVLPPAAAGERVVLRLAPGAEGLVWINGEIAGSVDWAHTEITLDRRAAAGACYDILLEVYAGHGKVSTGEGPVPPGAPIVPDLSPNQRTLGESSFGIWREEVYQLALDFSTLYDLRGKLDPLSLRVAEIDQALMDTTLLVDLELPEAEMLGSVRQGRLRLQPVLDCKNGSTAPTLYAFGHAHLDVAWLWPLAETQRKIARTTANQLALIEEYPAYRFLQSQPHLYWLLQQDYPELYGRLKEAIRSGQVIADGGMWVEADTNITGGESLIRQIIHGRRFFQEEFGIDSRILWLPDVFGYSGALPQILRGCGMLGFTTQKITWAYNGGDPFPYNTFLWEGIDGTAIPAHIFTDYNSQTRPSHLLERWNTRLQKNGIDSLILAFGHGDGGGGATRDHLEYLCREADLEGLPRLRMASPAEFFQDLERRGQVKQRYVGELYFQAHRGTYTSQARTKQGNRMSEFALREAEFWATAARALNGFPFTARTLDNAWRKLLLNQFHDILPGSSIQRVYEEAESAFSEVIDASRILARKAAATFVPLASNQEAYTVFNSLPWERIATVSLPGGSREVRLPACGWKTVRLSKQSKAPDESKAARLVASESGEYLLENEFLRARFNLEGELASWLDKDSGRELMAAPGNRFRLYKDVPSYWDAWDVDSMAEDQPVPLEEPVALEVICAGPLEARLRLIRKLHASTLSQDIILRRNSRRIEFSTTVDWQENHKLLKVCFPVDIFAYEAIHEIQFGHIRRPNHRSRPYDADRFEVCNHKWSALAEENRGVAILNDCKYGLSVTGNSLNLTLLKSALAPDPGADRGLQTFTYAVFAWNGSLAESGVVREAYELNCPVLVLPGASKEGAGSLFQLDAGNIILETFKPAEDGSSDVILRLYESKRMATRCRLSTCLPVKSASQENMIEEPGTSLPLDGSSIALDFRPFEIKTVRLTL